MLYSRAGRLIFVHIPKTGGNSVKALLRAHLTDLERIGKQHDKAAWHHTRQADWGTCFKFAFVRNPWDRLVSWHSYMRVRGQPPPWHRRLRGKDRRSQLARYAWRRGRRFEDFVQYCTDVIEDPKAGRRSYAWNQLDYLTDADGRLLVDYVGRFERLAQDCAIVAARLGFDAGALPHANASRHAHYSTYYTPALRDVVAERFARDIAAFGYVFEAAPWSPASASGSAQEGAAC